MRVVLRTCIRWLVSLGSAVGLDPIPGNAQKGGHDIHKKEDGAEAADEEMTVAHVEVRKSGKAPVQEIEEAISHPALSLQPNRRQRQRTVCSDSSK